MSITKTSSFEATDNTLFFEQNIGYINKKVCNILFATAIVPVLFIILTLAGIWIVPHKYSALLILYTLATGTIDYLLNKKQSLQRFAMTFGLLAATGFVLFLGSSNIILISISYGLVPFLSCLYYNKRLTKFITFINYFCVIFSYIMRAFQFQDAYLEGTSEISGALWFVRNFPGATIEFVFVLLISDYISKRTHNTMSYIIQSHQKIKEQSDSISVLNKELNQNVAELKLTQDKIIEFVAKVLGSHDLFTGQHVIHTKTYVEIIAHQLRQNGFYTEELTDENINLFKQAAFLHDIGKIHIPEAVLNKMGKFTDEEFKLMQCHPGRRT